ncbi:MAG TPA: hypothetical protein PKJ37_00065 [Acidobacteriota bacterium]|nr:hypothetical protein [Acidobacteriota bacterium]HNT16273.1 hypothetical protein [Acidobacteriota bacterium]
MPFIPEPALKVVKIPIEIREGKIRFFYEGPLPQISEGTRGDLIVPEYSVQDKDLQKLLSSERKIPFLKGKTILYVHVVIDHCYGAAFLKEAIPEDICWPKQLYFVKIMLQEPLFLLMRGTKKPTLSPVKCQATAEYGLMGGSLNQIYTNISQRYERYRVSHSGNVFKKIFFENEKDAPLVPLEKLRLNRELLFEERFYNE